MRGGCIRVATSSNVDWYKDLCSMFQSTRRRRRIDDNDTRVKRQNILRVLQRLVDGKATTSTYAPFLLEVAKEMQEQWRSLDSTPN